MARSRKVAAKWIKTAADERAVAEGCYFDPSEPNRVRQFLLEFCRHSRGKWASRPFELQRWQFNDVVSPLYGWRRADGSRRYRRGYIECPKKNGKSAWMSALSLYGVIGEGEPGASVANGACDRAQSAIVFDEAAEMVRRSPELSSELEIVDSRKTIVHRASASKYQALSADVPGKEGLDLSLLVIDELHAHRNRGMFDVLLHAGAARRQPLALIITTAGVFDPASIGWEQHQYARGVLDGSIEDTAFFAYIAAADPLADWTSPETWKSANPSIGVTVTLEELAEQCRAAQHSPALENAFKRYRLNIWTQQAERWLPLSVWDGCEGHEIRDADYVGRRCFGGIDLGSVSDLSVEALLFDCPHENGAIDVVIRAWLPEAALKNSKQQSVYEQWRREGHLSVTPGNATDYGFIKQRVLEDASRFVCDSIAIDRLFQGLGLSQSLADEGLPMFPVGMGFLSMSPLVSELERLVLAGKLHHGGAPILRAAVDAVEMVLDAAGNRKPSRADRTKKIDALVAVLFALDRWLRQTAVPSFTDGEIKSLADYL